MIVKKYLSEVVSIIKHTDGLYTLEFRSGTGKFKYSPGQFLHLALDENYDGSGQWPDSRCFSMQSNPDEELIRITYSVKGRFTRLMEEKLIKGSIVWLKLPYGDLFSKPHSKNNTVFIAGGTGITPFLSLFTDPSFQNYYNPMAFFGFRDKLMNFYYKELERANIINQTLSVKIFFEQNEGLINIYEVLKMSQKDSSFFISGPPTMINDFKLLLIKEGISISNIFTDNWN